MGGAFRSARYPTERVDFVAWAGKGVRVRVLGKKAAVAGWRRRDMMRQTVRSREEDDIFA